MVTQLRLHDYPHISIVEKALEEMAPYLAGIVGKQQREFGEDWLKEFEKDLAVFFKGKGSKLSAATRGYIRFALDGMLLQKRFDKTGIYESKTFEKAASEVYQNEEYMFTLYLPGIYLSHFLWRHHYLQHIFFIDQFLPLVRKHGGRSFYDVGVGTGFYSKEMLRLVPEVTGCGFDLSKFSLSYAKHMLAKFSLTDRYSSELRDIVANPPQNQASFLMNVEVLEHLEDPQSFLIGLYELLEPKGVGMITAAVTAPNADHIYLYNSAEEVLEQISNAGFRVIEFREDAAYEPSKTEESVPRNVAVIVSK